MLSGSIQKRLAALETRASTVELPNPIHPVSRLLDVLVAYHLGNMNEVESLATGMSRRLGYDSPADLRAALAAGAGAPKSADLDNRWEVAMRRLFALKGTRPGCDVGTFGATLEALRVEMPDGLQRHPFIMPSDEIDRAVNVIGPHEVVQDQS